MEKSEAYKFAEKLGLELLREYKTCNGIGVESDKIIVVYLINKKEQRTIKADLDKRKIPFPFKFRVIGEVKPLRN